MDAVEPVGEPQAAAEPEDAATATPRRSRRLRLLTIAAGIVAAAAAAGAGLLLERPSDQVPETGRAVLSISIPDAPVRGRAADGGETIAATARIANDGDAPADVPAMRATMRGAEGRVLRQWPVRPDAARLPAHGTTVVRVGPAAAPAAAGPLTIGVDAIRPDER
jgi:hypothetical protein